MKTIFGSEQHESDPHLTSPVLSLASIFFLIFLNAFWYIACQADVRSRIRAGMSEQEVVEILGKPDSMETISNEHKPDFEDPELLKKHSSINIYIYRKYGDPHIYLYVSKGRVVKILEVTDVIRY